MTGSGHLRRVVPVGREVVRLRVVAALESGAVGSYRQAAEVSERSVGSWWRASRSGGREALAVKRESRPGPHELPLWSAIRSGRCCSRRWPITRLKSC